VRLDRFDAKEQLGGDLPVAQALRSECGDALLAGGERIAAGDPIASWPSPCREQLLAR
jgi:hypothetical protein